MSNLETGQTQALSSQGARYPFWYEEVGEAMFNVRHRLLIFGGYDDPSFHPAGEPVKVFPAD